MSKAKELAKKEWGMHNTEDYLRIPSYYSIIESFGKVLVESSDNNYQGSTYALIESNSKLGYLEFGWGSCSGCDALEACDSYEDVDRLIMELESSIIWFYSKEDFIKWVKEKDWQGSFSWHDGIQNFLKEVEKLFDIKIYENVMKNILIKDIIK